MTFEVIVLPGDGIGPEVMDVARDVLDTVNRRCDLSIEIREFGCGAEYYRRTGSVWEEGAKEACSSADAVLLGAVGNPSIRKPDGSSPASEVIIFLRNGLELFANLRPVKPLPGAAPVICGKTVDPWPPGKLDFVIVRENTEGLYCRHGGRFDHGENEYALDKRILTRKGCERIHRFAFGYAAAGGRAKVTCVDKSNVLTGCRFFRGIFDEISGDFPAIGKEYQYVDAFMMRVMKSPDTVDVAVMSNLFGDIVSDGAAVLLGGMGMAPSANIGAAHAMFEPVHGSAPDIVGSGKANPTAMILSVKMMLEWWAAPWRENGRTIPGREMERFREAAVLMEEAVAKVLSEGRKRAEHLPHELGGSASCNTFGKSVARKIMKQIECD